MTVDEALKAVAVYARSYERDKKKPNGWPGTHQSMVAMTLAAEVNRLRALLDASCSAVDSLLINAVMGPEVERINAKLARVEALIGDDDKAPLPARWYGNMRYLGVTTACDEIRAALKDEP